MTIALHSVNDVRDVVNTISKYPYDVELASDRYAVNGKSIMGVFSLNLTQPIQVDAHTEDASDLMEQLEKFKAEA